MQARREVCIAVEGFLLEGLRWGYAAYLVEGISGFPLHRENERLQA